MLVGTYLIQNLSDLFLDLNVELCLITNRSFLLIIQRLSYYIMTQLFFLYLAFFYTDFGVAFRLGWTFYETTTK